MKKKDFYKDLLEYLELDETNLDETTNLKALEGFDSMSILSVIAFCDEKFGKKFTAQQLNAIITVKNLMELIGMEEFED
ncbi:MAG: acyl carrier protein [Bacteroidales bacterium]|nr:acyl carrier protein [Bacteroidales bacterium]